MTHGYLRLASATDLFHCTHVKLMHERKLDDSMGLGDPHRLHYQLLVALPVLKIPFRFHRVVGRAAYVLIP